MPKSPVAAVPAAPSAEALARFESSLQFETDCWDTHDALARGPRNFVLLDVRSAASFARGHVPGAVHLPAARSSRARMREWPQDTLFVTYCAGPHCNVADARGDSPGGLGRPVKIMIGGVTGWIDEGFELERGDAAAGMIRRAVARDAEPLLALMRELARSRLRRPLRRHRARSRRTRSRARRPGPVRGLRRRVGGRRSLGYAVVVEIPFTFDLRPPCCSRRALRRPRHRAAASPRAVEQARAWPRPGRRPARLDGAAGQRPAQAFYRRAGGPRTPPRSTGNCH